VSGSFVPDARRPREAVVMAMLSSAGGVCGPDSLDRIVSPC